jgi:RNA recognition motif-containing protein
VSAFLAAGERRSYPPQTQAQTEPRSDFSFLPQLTSNQSSAAFEESWNSPANAQARAILANLTGPNGEQLSSADPYNTTVFVGGLSPLISEETLRTFFAPFGDIHYVCPSSLLFQLAFLHFF